MRTSAGVPTEVAFIFNNMLRKLTSTYHPEWVAAVFESEGPTLREQEFAEYKANRLPAPPDFLQQIPHARQLLAALRIPVLEYPGFEADDVIGTIARRVAESGVDVVIVSSDKDLMQLVDDRVSLLNPAKDDQWYGPTQVKEFLGVAPPQVADLLALKGDAVDNIPGAPGIGDKGARDLIERFGDVENAMAHAAEVERKAYRESLQQNQELIRLSKRLATVETNVPIEFSLDEMAASGANPDALQQLYQELEFHSLLRDLEPAAEASEESCRAFASAEEVESYVAGIPAGVPIAVSVESGSAATLGFQQMALCWRAGEAGSFPLALASSAKTLLEDPRRPKIACDAKEALITLWNSGLQPEGFTHDIMLYGFLLSADPAGCSLKELSQRLLGRPLPQQVESHASATLEIYGKLNPEMDSRGFRNLYDTVEQPLIAVLARMEETGVRIDSAQLGRLSKEMESGIARLTSEIHQLAGKPFNVNSPQQLAKVLFEDLGLPAPPKSGKTKSWSTAADVLEGLAERHEIASKILDYRQLAKLKGTYVDALPELIRPSTGRVHTSFNQAGAATGRLSSSNPNLQNIPIRTELGREIRSAFVPRDGWKLLAADYSQIELRLLAHMSLDAVLVEAFRRGEDIHTRTAAEVFGVPPLLVTPDMRRGAKAVNFGIVYGISAFGLAAQLGIDRKQAELYIQSYFERYQGVRKFIDSTIAEVRRTGFTKTLLGRQRPIPDIDSRNPNARGFAERTAVNSPLQGTAADLIKLAMIQIDAELRRGGYRTAMLIQVHDELLFESPPEEIAAVSKLVKQKMENVHRLEVPLLVDVCVGDNWRDAK